jgi:CheY-like chemotaxis protein
VLNNAAKFTDPGGHITVSVRRELRDAVLRVMDTGVGISPEGLATVFELFTQGQRRLDRASGGLGIGLSLVRRLVEMHGGQVEVESEGLGCGTSVTIRLPAIMLRETPQGRAAANPATADIRYRVLVVDDNVDGADTLAAILRTFGHDVLTAEDGVEALRVGPTFLPDVTLLDLGMPRLNGYETARHMRELPWGRNVALIALTGFGQQKDREDTLRAGFDAHLVKPVDIDELRRVLTRVAARRTRRG